MADTPEPGFEDRVAAIVEQFVYRIASGEALDEEGFCAGYPEELRPALLARCREAARMQKTLRRLGSFAGRQPPQPGDQLGEFRIQRELGRGGMGVVYLAWQEGVQRPVALKVLRPMPLQIDRLVRRFRQEAASAGRLRHPGIVQIHSVGETDGWLYIAMEYFEGRTLAQHLEEARGSSPPDPSARWRLGSPRDPEYALRACRIVQQMAEALDHAHRHGVIHRDVKPQNVVLDEEGAPHLVDFGLARTLADPRISETGEQIGTPYYMSPEQARAETTRIDHRSDVFSLGVVLYEVLTLRRPFDGGSREEILAAITTVQPRQIRAVNPLVPVDVETICLQCMEKEPRHRYASAADLATDLGRALHVQPIVARRPTRWDHGLRRLRRRWRESAVVAAVGVGALLAWWGTRGAPVPEPLVAITVHAPDDARAFAQEMRFLEEPGSSRYLGAGPEVAASLPRGIYRVTVRNSLGFAEITLQARKEPVEVTAVIRPTPEVVRDMVPIPGGDFVFGHPEEPPPYDRRREHVADFYIDRTEVSNRQYQRFVQATGHPEPPSFASKAAWTEREWDLPVVTVTYLDAKEYAAWAGKRLPTYKEWSRAARGTGGLELPWPPDDRPPEQHARVGPQVEVVPAYSSFGNQQYLQLASPVEDALDDVSPEGVKQMLGNVMEITDTVLVDLIGGELVENPTLRWTRGFSYAPTDVQHMLSGGTQFPVDQRHHLVGFRCAKSAGFDEP